MSLRSQFTDAEWQTLQQAPIYSFLVTAGADKKIDDKEKMAFAKELAESRLYNDELAREVFSSCGGDINTLLRTCLSVSSPQELISCLQSARTLLDTKAPEHAEHFKRAVLLICRNVAEASGGGVFRSKKISEKEMENMALLAATLGVRFSD